MSQRFFDTSKPFQIRTFGAINWVGLWTLYLKEVKRFMNVFIQTVAAPALTSWIFLLVMTLALGRSVNFVNGVPFSHFLFPGLIIMGIAQNAFANTSSSITTSKIGGSIVDVLLPPISNREFIIAYSAAALTRGFLVGLIVWAGAWPFLKVIPQNIPLAIFVTLLASLMLGLMGLMTGIWAQKFDQLAIITNFVVAPLTFLSGTFYSISRLPDFVQPLVLFNPFFYMIDVFRYTFIGNSDASPVLGLCVLIVFNLILFVATWKMLASGFKIKS